MGGRAEPDEVDDCGPAAAAAAVSKRSVHEQRMVERGVSCFQRDCSWTGERSALRGRERALDCGHVSCKAGDGQHARLRAFALGPQVTAWNILALASCDRLAQECSEGRAIGKQRRESEALHL
jgi:hypothetical protein